MTSFFQASQSLLASVRAAIWPAGETGAGGTTADAGNSLLRDVLIAPALSGADDTRVRDALAVVAGAAAPLAAAIGASSHSLDRNAIEEMCTAAATAERQRCSDILRSDAAKGRMPLALHMAFSSNRPAADCLVTLAFAPSEQSVAPPAAPVAALSPLDAFMAKNGSVSAPVPQPKPPARADLGEIYAARAAAVGPDRREGAGTAGARAQAPREASPDEIYASRAAAARRANAVDLGTGRPVRGESDE